MMPLQQASPPAVFLAPDDVRKALTNWHSGGVTASGIDTLYLFRRAQLALHGSPRYGYNHILRTALTQLAQHNPDAAQLLQLRFLDNLKADKVANQLNLALSTFYERQKSAIYEMTVVLQTMELQARQERYALLERKLARQSHRAVVGVSGLVASLCAQLMGDQGHAIIAIEGIGGIGKTTLAGEVARRVLYQDASWDNIAWVTARPFDVGQQWSERSHPLPLPEATYTIDELLWQLYLQLLGEATAYDGPTREQKLARLEHYLHSHKSLVVIDNLETLVDLDALLPLLLRLSGLSKFIITTRLHLAASNDLYRVQLHELDEADALLLVRSEARTSNLMDVVAASDEELRPIYATVGGNPLALRLLVGQLHIFDLGQVLADLKEARGQHAERLYTFIFRRAWEYLDEPARLLLIGMLLTTAEGAALELLEVICSETVSKGELRTALQQLVALNLVESRGGLLTRHFTIHNLTRSFLHRQVQLWQEH